MEIWGTEEQGMKVKSLPAEFRDLCVLDLNVLAIHETDLNGYLYVLKPNP